MILELNMILSGWAQIASEEGVILICPEWQGHTYQGYT